MPDPGMLQYLAMLRGSVPPSRCLSNREGEPIQPRAIRAHAAPRIGSGAVMIPTSALQLAETPPMALLPAHGGLLPTWGWQGTPAQQSGRPTLPSSPAEMAYAMGNVVAQQANLRANMPIDLDRKRGCVAAVVQLHGGQPIHQADLTSENWARAANLVHGSRRER